MSGKVSPSQASPPSCQPHLNLRDSSLKLANLRVLSYVLKLPFMTYNAYLVLVVLAGAGTGYLVLRRKNARLLDLELAEARSFMSHNRIPLSQTPPSPCLPSILSPGLDLL